MLGIFAAIGAAILIHGLAKDQIDKKNVNTNCIEDNDAYTRDVLNGVPHKQRMQKMRAGLYRRNSLYPEPHRDKNGKIVIENIKLYEEDKRAFGAEVLKFAERGKYNLTEEELVEERKRRQKENEEYHRLATELEIYGPNFKKRIEWIREGKAEVEEWMRQIGYGDYANPTKQQAENQQTAENQEAAENQQTAENQQMP